MRLSPSVLAGIPHQAAEAKGWLAELPQQLQGPWEEWGFLTGEPWRYATGALKSMEDPDFHRFVFGLYGADITNYAPAFQVSYDRLLFTVGRFPQGFTLWMGRNSKGWWPIGYSGWHPVSRWAFTCIEADPMQADLGILLPSPQTEDSLIYLFNYSIHPSLTQSSISRALLEQLAQQRPAAFPCCAATVSEAGARIARRFGMDEGGYFIKNGQRWGWFRNSLL